MRTLEVKVRGKSYKGREAVSALYLLFNKGIELGCHFTDVELPPEERLIWRPIRKDGKVIGSVSWSYTDDASADVVSALEIGASIQREAKERKDVRIKVGA